MMDLQQRDLNIMLPQHHTAVHYGQQDNTQQSTFGHAKMLGSYATAPGRHCGAAASPAHNAHHPQEGHTTINLRARDDFRIIRHCPQKTL